MFRYTRPTYWSLGNYSGSKTRIIKLYIMIRKNTFSNSFSLLNVYAISLIYYTFIFVYIYDIFVSNFQISWLISCHKQFHIHLYLFIIVGLLLSTRNLQKKLIISICFMLVSYFYDYYMCTIMCLCLWVFFFALRNLTSN